MFREGDSQRGSGRTTRMLYKAQRYAEAHPQERVWIVCATEAQAQMLKATWRREYGVGTNNIEFINLHQAQNAYSHTTYKVFWDHYAAEEQMTKDIADAYQDFYRRMEDSRWWTQ